MLDCIINFFSYPVIIFFVIIFGLLIVCSLSVGIIQIFILKHSVQKALLDMDYAKTLKICNFLLLLSNKNFYVFLAKAIAYSGQGNFSLALDECAKAENLNQKSQEINYTKALILTKMGKLKEALNECNKGLELNKNALIYSARSLVWLNLKDYSRAFEDNKKAIELSPDHTSYNFRGVINFQQDKLDDALADLNKAIELSPRFYDAYSNRAAVYLKQGKYESAIKDSKHAIDICKKCIKAHINMIEALLVSGKIDEAKRHFDFLEGIFQTPEEISVLSMLEYILALIKGNDLDVYKKRFEDSVNSKVDLMWSFDIIQTWLNKNSLPQKTKDRIIEISNYYKLRQDQCKE